MPSKEIKINEFEQTARAVGNRKTRDFGKEFGGHSRVLDGYIELENGTRVHPENPNIEVSIYEKGGGEE